MKIKGFTQLIGGFFDLPTGIWYEVDFTTKTFRTTYGHDQIVDVELPPDEGKE